MVTDDTPDDGPTVAQQIAAAQSLSAGSPNAIALDLLADRRLALRWLLPLFLLGFTLLSLLVISQSLDRRQRFAISDLDLVLIVSGLTAGLLGAVRRWLIDWSRLSQRHGDAVLNRRQRLRLLAGINRGESDNRTPLALLRELAEWRIASAPADAVMMVGLGVAWLLGLRSGRSSGTWPIAASAIVVVVAIVLVITTVRERSRCRRFLADSAHWN